MICVPCKSIHC